MREWFLDLMFPLGSNSARLDRGAFFANEPGASTRPVVAAERIDAKRARNRDSD